MFDIDTRSVTFNLIAINVFVFITCLIFPNLNNILALHYIFNTHSYGPNGNFLPIQVISHMFMHGGIGHIFFNMFALLMFGMVLERIWGPKRFLSFYFLTGFGAVLLHMLVEVFLIYHFTGSINPSEAVLASHKEAWGTYFSVTVGASGAIFGVLAAFAMLFPNTELIILFFPVPIKAKYAIAGYVVLELFLGVSQFSGDNVAHFAHLGGALFGYLIVKYWNRNHHSLY